MTLHTYRAVFLKHAFIVAIAVVITKPAVAFNINFLKFNIFKSCTNTCTPLSICDLENDEDYRFCLHHCAHKVDVKTKCQEWDDMRPLLPYENHYKGQYNTNQVSKLALRGLDRKFIEQTSDRRRAVGTAKTLLLVREQFVHGKHAQLKETQREELADRLFLEYFKYAPGIINQYRKNGAIDDDSLSQLYINIIKEIMTKVD